MKFFLKLNLQFFAAEDSHPFAEVATPSEPHPFAADPSDSAFAKFAEGPNPLLVDYDSPETPQLQQPSQGLASEQEQSEQSQIEKLNFGGREVEVVDPIIHDLHKDYSNLNREFQQRNQELIAARQQAEQWQQLAQQQQQVAQPSPQQTQSTNEISEERLQQLNEEYMERMYENKFAADQWWNSQPEIIAQNQERQRAEIESLVQERLAPIMEERQALQAQQVAEQFRQSHPDFEDYRETMNSILRERPYIENHPDALEVLYAMAKVQAAPPQPTFESMLADPTYQQKILENEEIKAKVFQSYQQTKLQANQQLPNLMGNPVGSQTPMSAGERLPRSLSEATNFWLRSQGQ